MKYFTMKNWKTALIRFLITFLIGIFFIGIAYNQNRTAIIEELGTNVEYDIERFAADFERSISDVSTDVFLMRELITYRDSIEINGTEVSFTATHEQARIAAGFMNFLSVKTTYDQIRVIDLDGQEMIRVNYNNGSPSVVEDEDLQDKSGRYYFENAIILNENDFYISPLDLNVENGEIELVDGETKPMIRFATPLYSEDDEKVGILIVNYLAKDLFDSIDNLQVSEYSNFEVLNSDGYFLHSINKEIEYGFMYDELEDEVYSKYHEFDLFENVEEGVNQTMFEDELYTYNSVTEESLKVSIERKLGTEIEVISESGNFVIFGEVNFNAYDEYNMNSRTFITIGLIYLALSLVFSKLVDEIAHLRKQQLSVLEHNAKHDVLTGLPNRLSLFEDINYMVSREYTFTVLYIDFDGFKFINDDFGHDIGDEALKEGTKRIGDSIRRDDILSRVGGDEFVVVLRNVDEKKVVSKIAKKLIDSFEEEFLLKGNTCKMGISIGISSYEKGKDTESIISEADKAMYVVKESGKNNYSFFE